jgi:hypothetical protein
MKVTLGPDEESFFCWDDPSTNQNTIDVTLTPIMKDKNPPIKYQIKVGNR